MKRQTVTFRIEFVKSVPREMEEKVLYISIPFSTAIHLCPCGCKSEVVTKLSPSRWSMIYDGETVSLYPSIGNSRNACKTHYWFEENQIIWEEDFTDEEIEFQRKKQRRKGRNLFPLSFHNKKKAEKAGGRKKK